MVVYHEAGRSAFPSSNGMGMTLRDYFAAKAMQALVTEIDDDGSYWMPEHVAELAYSQADEMLKAREA